MEDSDGTPDDDLLPVRRRADASEEEEDDADIGQQDIEALLGIVDEILGRHTDNARKRHAFEQLCVALRPQRLSESVRRVFVGEAMARGVVSAAVQLIELGVMDLACAASNFLGDFAFNSDAGARAVLEVFDRIAACFQHIFRTLALEHLPLLDAAILLCVNIAATCPSGHSKLVPLVRPVCLQIIQHPGVSDKLRGNTILLLANLSMTVGSELRELRVADVLLNFVTERRLDSRASWFSVAESFIIFLHGSTPCREIDVLMASDVIAAYCVPIMERTLRGEAFRGMYPHLLYSARLFQVLAQSRPYAERLAANPEVAPLLMRASSSRERPTRVDSDLEGRRLALEALGLLASFGLFGAAAPGSLASEAPGEAPGGGGAAKAAPAAGPPAALPLQTLAESFIDCELPVLLQEEHAGIRASAAVL